jgi:cathepsin B
LDDVKVLFQSYLSDDFKEIYYCNSREEKNVLLSESYDFRVEHKECLAPIMNQGNCSSAYALAMSSMISDRLCLISGSRTQISAQHVISCDVDINEGCRRGYSQRVFDYYSKNKMHNESCMPYKGGDYVNCSQKCNETLAESGRLSRVCGVDGEESIKREIKMNGPVIASLEIHSDFLTYKSGVYNAELAPYVYAGGHVVKIIGWGVEKGRKYWLIENTWGADWGEEGLGKIEIIDKDDLHISQLVIASVIEGKKEEKKAKKEEEPAEKKEETAEKK